MTIQSPQFFWSFLTLPLIWILYMAGHARGYRSLNLLGYQRRTKLVSLYTVRSFSRLILLSLFLIFAFLALVDLKWGTNPISTDDNKLDAAVVLDISNSMLTDDVNSSRLDRSKDAISLLFDALGDTRFSFTLFKGEGVVYIPLTEDTIALHNLIEPVNPQMISSPGSNMEKALNRAISTLPDNQERNRAVFMFTDGDNLVGNPLNTARKMKNENIQLFLYGVGDPEQLSPIPLSTGEYLRNEWGDRVMTKQNQALLKEMALLAGGEYTDLSDVHVLGELGQNIEKIYGIREARGVRFEERYRYRIFLGGALFFLLLYKFTEKMKWTV